MRNCQRSHRCDEHPRTLTHLFAKQVEGGGDYGSGRHGRTLDNRQSSGRSSGEPNNPLLCFEFMP